MKVNELNDKMLNELDMKKIKDGIVNATKKAATVVKDEYNDNKKAFSIIKNLLVSKMKNTEEPSKEDYDKALQQILKDNPKLLTIGAISALPGSVITLPIVIKGAKKFGIDLIPKKTF